MFSHVGKGAILRTGLSHGLDGRFALPFSAVKIIFRKVVFTVELFRSEIISLFTPLLYEVICELLWILNCIHV